MELFNTTIIRENTEYIPYAKEVTIHEHKAPTDNSIKLFGEYVEKAEKYIVDAYTIKNNILNDIHVFVFNNPLFYKSSIRFCFSINGKKFDREMELDPILDINDMDKNLKKIYENISKLISERILIEGFSELKNIKQLSL